ncbi:hypothetical protein CJ030_MR8G023192 [Morella rubra]|uniref:ENT domain-containing protein n=1 Tax=Morella rubra TaxID=262757 RepID=A0A6A1USR6_9ROSI|nr:hypothetical protein CJ030_MR8G023192 [Morella rubra]
MRFKKGSSVEVLKRENDPCGSWFPGRVISADGNHCTVRYERLLNHKGEPEVQRVNKDDVRPQPPHEKGERWMVGDIAEVFDIHCWRVAKIVKALKNIHFVVRLFGCIQLKEVHKSNLRIRQAWHSYKWSAIGKTCPQVQRNKETADNHTQDYLEQPGSLICRATLQAICQGTGLRANDGEKLLKDGCTRNEMCLPGRASKRSHASCSEPTSEDLLMVRSCKKSKSSRNAGGHDNPLTGNHSSFMHGDDISSPRVDENFTKKSTQMDAKMKTETNYWMSDTLSLPLPSEDSYGCSVASCSMNTYSDCPGDTSGDQVENTANSSDAESSFLPLCNKIHSAPWPRRKLEVDIHKLELQAYNSTVRALYALGPLSWEQESLLTNLRLSLHISNDEHLLQLRHLLSTQVH